MNLQQGFSVGEWKVYPLEGRLIRDGEQRRVQPKSMDVLLRLAERAGTAVERDELLDSVWAGRAISDEPLTRCIGELRRALGDTKADRQYIETIPKRGYKLLQPVRAIPPLATVPGSPQTMGPFSVRGPRRTGLVLLVGAAVIGIFAAGVRLLTEDSRHPAPPVAVPDAVNERHTIAILPFENLSGDAVNDPITEGIHDDILTQVSRISALQVISRTSTLGYRGTDKDLKTVGSELGADGILEGSVQRSGDRIRVNAQLIMADTDTHLWAESYDRELTAANIFAIQSEIATAIAGELEARMKPEEERLIRSVPTENLAALEAYFQGKYLMGKRTTESTMAAEAFFVEAVELDPGLALAWVGLAQNYVLQIFQRGELGGTLYKYAEAAIKRALELEYRLGEAHAALGRLLQLRGDFVAAEFALQRAIELSPNDVNANHAYGLFLDYTDRSGEAAEYLRKAIDLDPRSPLEQVGYGGILESLGRFDEALEHFERSIEIDPKFASGIRLIGHLDWRVNGRLDRAVEWYVQAVELDPDRVITPAVLSWLYLDLGDTAMAESWRSRVEEMQPRSFHAARSRMLLDAYQGQSLTEFRYPDAIVSAVYNAWPTLALLVSEDLDAENIDNARARIETAFPGMMAVSGPEIRRSNVNGAIDLAYFLQRTGEHEAADELLDRCLSFTQTMPRLGWAGTMIADARIHALQGRTDEALAALRTAIDAGWRTLWWYYLDSDPALVSVREDPRFQALVDEVREDMAGQLARLKQTGYYDRSAPGALL